MATIQKAVADARFEMRELSEAELGLVGGGECSMAYVSTEQCYPDQRTGMQICEWFSMDEWCCD